LVGLCRRDLSCSIRESRCTRGLLVDDGVRGVTDGVVILEGDRVVESTGDRVDGV
jgi:hypothetical protein